jgi:hypothetical protein
MGCLYRIDFDNGKSYVGITTETAEKRFRGHYNSAYNFSTTNNILFRAIRKYGINRLHVKTLAIAEDWGYLCYLEQRAIRIYKTKTPHGYNMTDGGEEEDHKGEL